MLKYDVTTTLCDQVFLVNASQAWNGPPIHVQFAPLLINFRRQLKTFSHRSSFFGQ